MLQICTGKNNMSRANSLSLTNMLFDFEPIKYLHLPAQVFLICTVALALSQCFEGNVMLSLPLIKYIIFIDDRCDTYIHA